MISGIIKSPQIIHTCLYTLSVQTFRSRSAKTVEMNVLAEGPFHFSTTEQK